MLSATAKAANTVYRDGILLRLKVWADRAACATGRALTPMLPPLAWDRIGGECRDALDYFTARGWLDAPETYHPSPPALSQSHLRRARSFGFEYSHLRYRSGYELPDDEPGSARWRSYKANSTAHA